MRLAAAAKTFRAASAAVAVFMTATLSAQPSEPGGQAGPPDTLAVRASTRHLDLTATLSRATVAAGERLSITIDVVPRPGMHVYAPGSEYEAIALQLRETPLLKLSPPVYPAPAQRYFESVRRTVAVFDKPFRLVQEVQVAASGRASRRARTVRMHGEVSYQACDARYCYLPAKIPVSWTLRVQ
jgi:hypothetical protein